MIGERVTRIRGLPRLSEVDRRFESRQAFKSKVEAVLVDEEARLELGACPIFLGKMASAGVANKGVTG